VGDSCYNLARILRRKREHKMAFTPQMDAGIQQMFSLVEEALARMNTLLSGHKEDYGIGVSEDIERRINACRNALKRQNINDLDAHVYDYDKGTVFADLIGECEKTGDYIINVVEARLGAIRNGIRYRGIQMDTDAKLVSVDGESVSLTKTEYEILKLFLENRGKVFSRDELLSAVWPDDVSVTASTVDVNITRICKKIGAYADCIVTRAGSGYSFQE
jgi:phosphate:Na+ symporter